ncbi:MAG: hypothetical protein ACK55I_07990, partial [bacterium]
MRCGSSRAPQDAREDLRGALDALTRLRDGVREPIEEPAQFEQFIDLLIVLLLAIGLARGLLGDATAAEFLDQRVKLTALAGAEDGVEELPH